MKEVSIKNKVFTEEEVVKYGKSVLARRRRPFLIIGLILLGLSALYTILILTQALDIGTDEIWSALIMFGVVFAVPGTIFLIVSARIVKKDPYDAGVAFLTKRFPYPVGFDGNAVEVLKGDKTITLCNYPLTELAVSFNGYKFQVLQGDKYSRIFTPQDILEYEIMVNNEVVVRKKGLRFAVLFSC